MHRSVILYSKDHIKLCETSGFHSGKYEDDLSYRLLRRVVSYKLTNVSEGLTAYIMRAMMKAVSTSEMAVNSYETTRRNILEDIFIPDAVRS
jgi:hypothetical protein